MARYEKVLKAIERLMLTHEIKNKERYTVGMSDADSDSVTAWNITQLHTVGLLRDMGPLNNSSLSEYLGISKAAVTKITKKLTAEKIITEDGDKGNKKEKYFILTEDGERLAGLHGEIKEKAINKYIEVCEEFTDAELDTVADFINKMTAG